MNISTQKLPGWLELRVEGRLDAAWATLFTSTVADLVRVGSHTIRVDASKLEYISSAGCAPCSRRARTSNPSTAPFP
jgi:anti-anti-sigma regulatory factor